jgi:hypothetical protein
MLYRSCDTKYRCFCPYRTFVAILLFVHSDVSCEGFPHCIWLENGMVIDWAAFLFQHRLWPLSVVDYQHVIATDVQETWYPDAHRQWWSKTGHTPCVNCGWFAGKTPYIESHVCGMQFERFYSLNDSVVGSFPHLHHLWFKPALSNLGKCL